jgi:HD-like signal output (HDOD) protein/CheY-like chemotaxis protein
MKSLVFVDDEPLVLDGLRRMLHRYRATWNMSFVTSGEEALALMAESPMDIVVSDMRMPTMDGAELLKRVKDLHPRTVRIILSGHLELASALAVAQTAHQFLSKPCDSAVVRELISRAYDLHALMHDETLQRIVGGIDSLPALPSTYNELLGVLAEADVGLGDVSVVIEKDPSITAKILQLVNSSFFGIARPVESLRDATSYLGINTIRDLTLTLEVFRAFEGKRCSSRFSLLKQQKLSRLSGQIAHRLLDDKKVAESAFLAGMLHDLGRLILATHQPESYSRLLDTAAAEGRTVHEVERESIGVTNPDIGAYLLGLWGLPYTTVEAVAHHAEPSRVDHKSFDALSAVHVAVGLAHELVDSPDDPPAPLDLEYLERLGVLDRLPAWREMAANEANPKQSESA